MARQKGCEHFDIVITLDDGTQAIVHGEKIRRDTYDGAGNAILYARCYEVGGNRVGVVNLNADWTVHSLCWNSQY